MRIESWVNSNSNKALHPNKKQHKKKDGNKPPTDRESLELSEETRLLNKLLHATSNQFNPYPFYFANAAARNIKQACTISKNIQNQAESIGILLNYAMVYEMVIGLASQKHQNNIQWATTITTEYETLNNAEKLLFENLHNTCLSNQIPVKIIESIAIDYIQVKQNKTGNMLNRTESAQIIINQLKRELVQEHNSVKRNLGAIIKQYVNQQTKAEAY